MQLVFETHSTSLDNERGIATGWLEGELSETGREQAARLGDRRRDDGIDLVICSDLRRAVETVEIAFAGSPIPIRHDRRLRECNYGEWNGMPRAQLEAERIPRLDVPFPGGESWREAVHRHAGLLRELAAGRDGGRVLLVGHVATRWALDHLVSGVPLEQLAAKPFVWREGWEYQLGERMGARPFDLKRRAPMAVKLHRCPSLWAKFGSHPCWKVQKALDEQGVDYEIVRGPWPSRKNRAAVIGGTGQASYPAIEFDNGTWYREQSKDMATTIREGRLMEKAGTAG